MLHFILQANTVATIVADTVANTPGINGIQTAPEITETKISLFEMIGKGGPILYPMALTLYVDHQIAGSMFVQTHCCCRHH